jgi:biotin carboxyl carrier protein
LRYYVTIDGEEHTIDVAELPGGGYDVRQIDASGKATPIPAELVNRDGPLTLRIGGRVVDLVVDGNLPDVNVFASGRRARARVESVRARAAASLRSRSPGAGDGVVVSPMPGKVVKVFVKEGDSVKEGTPLVVVEAMKMENELVSNTAGIVQKVFVQPGDAVEGGARLVSVG